MSKTQTWMPLQSQACKAQISWVCQEYNTPLDAVKYDALNSPVSRNLVTLWCSVLGENHTEGKIKFHIWRYKSAKEWVSNELSHTK